MQRRCAEPRRRLCFDVARLLARRAGNTESVAMGRSSRENRSTCNPMQRRCVDRPVSPFRRVDQFRDHPLGALWARAQPQIILKTDELNIILELG
jgi:hypothetical protein